MSLKKITAVVASLVAACASACVGFAAPSRRGASNTASVPAYAIVDIQKIYDESTPGKAGAAHMEEVRKILQAGMDDVVNLNKGQENTPTARQSLAQAQQTLNRQLSIEQQATNAALEKELREAVATWRSKNKTNLLVLGKPLALGYSDSIDVTAAVMVEMNKRKATFPDLPKVTVEKNQPGAKK